MKISQQPTNHILVKAHCQSEWDNCDFAIIACGEGWREQMRKRLEAARQFNDEDGSLISFRYSDCSAEFCVSTDEDIDGLLSETELGNECAFVKLEEGEEEAFERPESRLDCRMLNLYKDGTGTYVAYGKHTGEEFYTDCISFVKILESLSKNLK